MSYSVGLAVQGTWSPKTSLPLALCDVGVLVAAAACWWRVTLLVELTYFWGLAGTLQAVITPDLNVGFPHLVFFQYLVGHVGIVAAALFLVVGMRIVPRRRSVVRRLLHHPRVHGVGGDRRRAERCQLHVPALAPRGMDAAATCWARGPGTS